MRPCHFCAHLISIHAPRTGCDRPGFVLLNDDEGFQSTHPARGATGPGGITRRKEKFQSTHPARGATRLPQPPKPFMPFQSTHPARGATMESPASVLPRIFQSTHPARGATLLFVLPITQCKLFQSTHPARGATVAHRAVEHSAKISIHAPRTGCDSSRRAVSPAASPFQSTHPARGATASSSACASACAHFNPRTPHGVRRLCRMSGGMPGRISIHAPRTGCDTVCMPNASSAG